MRFLIQRDSLPTRLASILLTCKCFLANRLIALRRLNEPFLRLKTLRCNFLSEHSNHQRGKLI